MLFLGIGGRLFRLNDVGADEKQQFGALEVVGVAAQQLAEDGNLEKKSDFAVGGRLGRSLQAAQHDHLAVLEIDGGIGFAMADDGLDILVDRDIANDIVHFLVNGESDVAVVADQRGDLEIKSDFLVGSNLG